MNKKDIIIVLPIVVVYVLTTEFVVVRPLFAAFLSLLTIPVTTYFIHKKPQDDKRLEKALAERSKRKSVDLLITSDEEDFEIKNYVSDDTNQSETNKINPMIGTITWSIAVVIIFFMLVSLF